MQISVAGRVVAALSLVVAGLGPVGSGVASAHEATPAVRIDAGGPGAEGNPQWSADSPSAPSPMGNGATIGAGQVATTSSAIDLSDPSVPAGTPMALFQAARADWSSAAPDLTYRVPATPGHDLRLRLFFAEPATKFSAPGARVFDVVVDGATVLSRFDIVAAAGGARRGIVRTHDIRATGDVVEVRFRRRVGPPIVSGLELVDLGEPAPPPLQRTTRVNVGGPEVAGDPAWERDDPASPSARGNAVLVGADDILTVPTPTLAPSVAAGTPAAVFRHSRVDVDPRAPDLRYSIPVEAGPKVVRLHLIEPNTSVGRGGRLMDVYVDGRLADDDVDIVALAGGTRRGVTRTYRIDSPGPALVVELRRVKRGPVLAALEVVGPAPVDRPGTWTSLAPLPEAVNEYGSVTLDGSIYVAGGHVRTDQGVVALDRHLRYDPSTGEVRHLAPLPQALDHVQAVALDGLIYYLGGLVRWPHEGSARVHVYDPATDTFTEAPALPRAKGGGAAVVHEGRIYYAGGTVGGRAFADFDVYDPATGTWTPLAPMPRVRDHVDGVVLGDGRLHLAGGRAGTADSSFAAHDAYDFAAGTWITGLAPLPTTRSGGGTVRLGDEMLVLGGELRAPDVALPTVEAYDWTTDTWRRLDDMIDPRHGFHASECDGTVFAMGGGLNSGAIAPTADVEALRLDDQPPSCPLPAPPPSPPEAAP